MAELSKAIERVGLDMRVAALVTSHSNLWFCTLLLFVVDAMVSSCIFLSFL